MRSWKTTLSGLIAAFGIMSLTLLQEFPTKSGRLLMVLVASALASLGYHAVDCSRCPGDKLRRVAGLALVGLAVACAGCAMAGFRLALSNPTFGSVAVGVGNAAIGNAYSNVPPSFYGPATGQETTNAPPSQGK